MAKSAVNFRKSASSEAIFLNKNPGFMILNVKVFNLISNRFPDDKRHPESVKDDFDECNLILWEAKKLVNHFLIQVSTSKL
jgi:hypothetical protein